MSEMQKKYMMRHGLIQANEHNQTMQRVFSIIGHTQQKKILLNFLLVYINLYPHIKINLCSNDNAFFIYLKIIRMKAMHIYRHRISKRNIYA